MSQFDVHIEPNGPQHSVEAPDGAVAACRAVIKEFADRGIPSSTDATVLATPETARYVVTAQESVEYERGDIDRPTFVTRLTARRVTPVARVPRT